MIDPVTLSAAVSGATAAYNGIKKAITIWPNKDQLVEVSKTVKPVTVDADVAVNKESINEIGSLWEKGRKSKIAPNNIKAKNP